MSAFLKLDPQSSQQSSQQPLQKMASIKNLPVNLFASVMGIAGLSIAWRQASVNFGVNPLISELSGILAFAVFILLSVSYLIKTAKYPQIVANEYKHPIAGNFFGTITIAILLLSSIVAPISQSLAEVMWTLGTLSTLALCFAMVSRLLKGKIELAHTVPAWFIPGVGTLDIPATGGTMPMAWTHELNLFSLAVGAVIALLFFMMIMSRLIHHESLPTGLTPSLLILMAPFEVGFLAYTNFTQTIDTFSGLLFYFGLFIFVILVPRVFRKGIPFASGWWAISFPMAALAIAALKYAMLVQTWPITVIAIALLASLSIAITVLFFKTLHYLFKGKLLAG